MDAEQRLHLATRIVGNLQFLAELILTLINVHAEDLEAGAVKVDVRLVVELPEGGDGFQRECIRERVLGGERDAFNFKPLNVIEVGFDFERVRSRLESRCALHERRPGADPRWRDGAIRTAYRTINTQMKAQIVTWGIGKLQAACEGLLVAVGIACSASELIFVVAVVREVGECYSSEQASIRIQGAAPARLELMRAKVANACFDRKVRGRRWCRADVLDRAANCIATIERALRTAQHFDSFHVHHIEKGALRPAHIDIVEVDANAGVCERKRVSLPNPANVDDRIGGIAQVEAQVGDDILNVTKILHLKPAEVGCGQRGDGKRRIREALIALAGSHDNFLDQSFCRDHVGQCGRRQGQRDEREQPATQRFGVHVGLHAPASLARRTITWPEF